MSWWSLDPPTFEAAVGDAVWAPSIHNSQPWRFRLDEEAIDVLLDPARLITACDPTGRAARISCGAAAYTLRLALAMRGMPSVVRVGGGPVMARLTPMPARPPNPLERRLHAAIPRRRTNRYRFADTPVDPASRAELIRAARDEGGWLDLLPPGPAIDMVAMLTREADEILSRSDEYVAVLRAWTRRMEESTDGISTTAGGPAPDPYEVLARRDFGGAHGSMTHDDTREPLVGVLGVFGDEPPDDVRAGMVLQRVLLTATDLGLTSALFSQPIEVPSVREKLRLALSKRQDPRMVLRFGYAVTRAHSRRRPVHEVIDVSHDGARR